MVVFKEKPPLIKKKPSGVFAGKTHVICMRLMVVFKEKPPLIKKKPSVMAFFDLSPPLVKEGIFLNIN